ncbi:MAG: hypothetical protein MI751_05305 [Pseudomonadales bacterium]|nr:hypothetical protein [Pseudomonadales bacterium]
MQRILALIALVLALAGCNGGEDFSDATVPGCPAGTKCDENVVGEVYVELVGPRVANIGYECGSSLGRTRPVDTTEGSTVIPAYTAVCPADARSIEFFLGSGLFEGNKVSLGSYLLPQQLQKETYQVTVADLIAAPRRSEANTSVIYRSALIQALDNDGNGDDAVSISDQASDGSGVNINDVIDDNPALIPSQPFDGYANYSDFTNAWSGMFTEISNQLTDAGEPDVAGFDGDTLAYEERVKIGTDRTRAGLFAYESAGECLIFQGCDFSGDDGSRLALGMRALVLPNGVILAGGQVIRSKDSDTSLDFVGLDSTSRISDILELEKSGGSEQSVTLTGAGVGATPPGNTDAELKGRILGQTMYAGVEVNGNGDYGLDYPNASYSLTDSDKGALSGEVLGENVPASASGEPVPVRGTKTGAVQVDLDAATLSLVAGKDYRVTLMRACVGEADDGSECSSIPDPVAGGSNEEIGDADGFNYPTSITAGSTTFDITSERPRIDSNSIVDFCLSIDAEGLITTGNGGACGADHFVGMVTRTLPDSNSVNVYLRLAPGMDVQADAPHYNAEVQGRIDLDESCSPMFRLGDEGFDNQVRAGWLESAYLPPIQRENWSSQDSPSDLERLVFASLQSGAVVFGEDGCTP